MKHLLNIFFVLIFLSLVKNSYSQNDEAWMYLCTSNTGEIYYLDTSSVEISGDHITFWYKATNIPDNSQDIRMSKERIFPATREYITVQSFYVSYTEGISGENFPYGEDKKAIVPRSVMETFCDYLYINYWNK